MQIQNQFDLPISPAESWTVVTDLPRVARCLPGAQITRIRPDGTHEGTVAVALGPASLTFAGEAAIDEADAEAYRLVLRAAGGERRGRGRASARIDVRLAAIDGGTRVDVDAELDLAGSIAQYGRRGGMLEDVSELLIDDFTTALREEILHGQPSSAAEREALSGAGTVSNESTPTERAVPSASSAGTASARPTGDGPAAGLSSLIPAPTPTPGSPASRRPKLRPAAAGTSQLAPPGRASAPSAPAARLSALSLARKLLMRRLRRLVRRRGRPGRSSTPGTRS